MLRQMLHGGAFRTGRRSTAVRTSLEWNDSDGVRVVPVTVRDTTFAVIPCITKKFFAAAPSLYLRRRHDTATFLPRLPRTSDGLDPRNRVHLARQGRQNRADPDAADVVSRSRNLGEQMGAAVAPSPSRPGRRHVGMRHVVGARPMPCRDGAPATGAVRSGGAGHAGIPTARSDGWCPMLTTRFGHNIWHPSRCPGATCCGRLRVWLAGDSSIERNAPCLTQRR